MAASIIYPIPRTSDLDGGSSLVADQPRFLVLGDTGLTGADWLRQCGLEGDCVHVDSWDAGLEQLRRQPLDAIVANPADPAVLRGLALVQSQHILAALPDGVAVVDANLQAAPGQPHLRGVVRLLGRRPRFLRGARAPSRTALR